MSLCLMCPPPHRNRALCPGCSPPAPANPQFFHVRIYVEANFSTTSPACSGNFPPGHTLWQAVLPRIFLLWCFGFFCDVRGPQHLSKVMEEPSSRQYCRFSRASPRRGQLPFSFSFFVRLPNPSFLSPRFPDRFNGPGSL